MVARSTVTRSTANRKVMTMRNTTWNRTIPLLTVLLILTAPRTPAQSAGEEAAVIRAGMAHLNLVMIHPFRDGNGRMARALQTLVLARDQIPWPELSSIEEYLGLNTPSYYRVLADVGGRTWQPESDTRPWIRFVLTAHHRQATTTLRRSFARGWRKIRMCSLSVGFSATTISRVL